MIYTPTEIPTPSTQDMAVSKVEGKVTGLKLTLRSPRLNDSGCYTCTASDMYQHIKTSVGLDVYQPGTYIKIGVSVLACFSLHCVDTVEYSNQYIYTPPGMYNTEPTKLCL